MAANGTGRAIGTDGVSILVFVELALDDSVFHWDYDPQDGFNPCFRGTCS